MKPRRGKRSERRRGGADAELLERSRTSTTCRTSIHYGGDRSIGMEVRIERLLMRAMAGPAEDPWHRPGCGITGSGSSKNGGKLVYVVSGCTSPGAGLPDRLKTAWRIARSHRAALTCRTMLCPVATLTSLYSRRVSPASHSAAQSPCRAPGAGERRSGLHDAAGRVVSRARKAGAGG